MSGFWENSDDFEEQERPKVSPLEDDDIEPQSSSECIGIKKGVVEGIKTWLREHEEYKSGIQLGLVLSGPPGCGKSALIRVLAKELDYELHILRQQGIYKENF